MKTKDNIVFQLKVYSIHNKINKNFQYFNKKNLFKINDILDHNP
jgi:hypothetical protein